MSKKFSFGKGPSTAVQPVLEEINKCNSVATCLIKLLEKQSRKSFVDIYTKGKETAFSSEVRAAKHFYAKTVVVQ